MISVLHVIDSNGQGGAELMLKDFIAASPDNVSNFVFTLAKDEKPVFSPDSYGVGVYTLVNTLKTLKLLQVFARKKPIDIVHTHSPISGLLCRMIFRKKKLLIHVHNHLSKTGFGNHKVFSSLEKMISKDPHAFAFVSKSCLKDYEKHFGVIKNSHLIYNSVHKSYYKIDLKEKKRTKKLRFVSVGNWKAQKGFDFLLKAFAGMPDEHLTIYSDLTTEEIQIKDGFSIPNNVKIIAGKEMNPAEYANYDVFISGSKYEGFGNAVLEAGLCGLILILPHIDVFQELFSEEATFYQPENVTSLKGEIKRISDTLPQKSTAKSLRFRFSPEERSNQLIELYKSMMK